MATADSHYRFDLTRHLKGAELPPELAQEFQRLVKDLRFGGKFQLLIAEFNDWTIRSDLIKRIAAVMQETDIATTQLELTDNAYPDVTTLEIELTRLSQEHGVIHVIGGEAWFDDARLEAFNLRREAIAQSLTVRLVLWLDESTVRRFAQIAPDWWAWRAGVFCFCVSHRAVNAEPLTPQLGPIDTRSLAKRSRRISELRAFLYTDPPPPDELAGSLWGELAGLYFRLGEWDKALSIRIKEQLPVYERLGDVRQKAITLGKIADIMRERGLLDEALRIRTEEQLPVYERLGDLREKAMTQGKIADILHARGQLDEALRIRTEEELPVFERLDDLREKAVTQIKIADILHARGQIDEALRIHTEEELPVYERLGDLREKAMTQGNIADILQARGKLDEALLILTGDVLPVFERLGDVCSKAGTQSKIADILQARGKLDEALRIRTEDVLPVFERIGDLRSKAVTQSKIADILQARGKLDEALRILTNELLPLFERLGDVRSKAVTLGQIADIMQTRGQWGESLRIRTEDELPVYERIGDVISKAVTLFNIARIELQQDRQADAFEHLAEAYRLAEQLKNPDGLAAVGEEYGKLLCEQGELEQGFEVLETAHKAALQLGQSERAKRIAELMQSFA
ncbi:MAG: tetratricopeptide repeat protein [Proteobacteria bacterium]|nr:tetratricopeptide repeat protein [Pseudomonadota bacterium]